LRPTVPEDMDAQSSLMTRLFWLGTAHDPDPKKLELNLRDSKPAHFFQNW